MSLALEAFLCWGFWSATLEVHASTLVDSCDTPNTIKIELRYWYMLCPDCMSALPPLQFWRAREGVRETPAYSSWAVKEQWVMAVTYMCTWLASERRFNYKDVNVQSEGLEIPEKIGDQLGLEPSTFCSLGRCSFHRATETEDKLHVYNSYTVQLFSSPLPLTSASSIPASSLVYSPPLLLHKWDDLSPGHPTPDLTCCKWLEAGVASGDISKGYMVLQ